MDDLHKRYIDRKFVALREDSEVQKFEQDVKAERPDAASAAIQRVLEKCAKVMPDNHPRHEILACVLRAL